MPSVSMSTFLEFCNAQMKRKIQIVEDQLRIAADSRQSAGRNPYGPLRAAIVRGHAKTQDLVAFEDTLETLVNQPRKQAWQNPRFKVLGDAYIDYCQTNQVQAYPGKVADLMLGGLTVKVRTETQHMVDEPHPGVTQKMAAQVLDRWILRGVETDPDGVKSRVYFGFPQGHKSLLRVVVSLDDQRVVSAFHDRNATTQLA